MNETELIEKLAKGEGFHTEFKETLPSREKLAKEIVCFANTNGGQLFIGVKDCGEIAGIENIDNAMLLIEDVAFQRCEPPITILQETIKIEDQTVLVVNIPKGSQRPYRTRSGQYYIRSSNRCRQASQEELLRLFQAGDSMFFDEVIVGNSNYSDIDLYSFQDFLLRHFDVKAQENELENYLKNLHIISEQNKPTVAGLLFFGKFPQNILPNQRIVCAYIKGDDLATPPFDKKSLNGKIPDLIDNAQKFLHLYLVEKHSIKGFEPEIEVEIPDVVLREAVVNAVAHRDYTIEGPIRIIVYDNRVEIRTPGKLPNSVTIESIKIGGSHVLRNPTIYNLLYKMGLVTDLGSGVRRMIQLMKKYSSEEIVLEEVENEFVLSIPRKQQL
ncbi:putative DNA binding domain-containing protein [candidate division KSB1 bacterium]|nr:putative DNA binding domain-containing protein [candidate division KSB1 bacterium]